MKRRITNNESSRSPMGVRLWRRLGCGLWFLVQTTGLTRDRRRPQGRRARKSRSHGDASPWTAVGLRGSSIHYAGKKTNRFNPFLILAFVAALTHSGPLRAQSAPLSLTSSQEVTPAGDGPTWRRVFEENG